MKATVFFGALLLVGLAIGAPTSDDDKVVITKDSFPDKLVKYTAKHDIVNILLPLNSLNFDEDDDDDDDSDNSDMFLFFVEADTNAKGDREYKGLYVLNNGVAKKLLDNGRDAAAANDESKSVYFAASDGLYVYNATKNEAVKYGTITDSIINIAKANGTDTLYILTDDHVLYKVIEEGTKKEKVDKVVNAQQIVVDYEGNVYYYTPDKQVYLFANDEVKKIEGLPSKASYVSILKPPFLLENGVYVVVDNKAYMVYPNGTSELTDFVVLAKPTAYSMEGTIIQYYAYNKKIYEYNLMSIILGDILNQIKAFFNDKSDSIQSIATRKRSELKGLMA